MVSRGFVAFSLLLVGCFNEAFPAGRLLEDDPRSVQRGVPASSSLPETEMETVVRLQHFEPGSSLYKAVGAKWDGMAVGIETRRTGSGADAGGVVWAGCNDSWWFLFRPYNHETPHIILEYATSAEYEQDQLLRNRCGVRHDGAIPRELPTILKNGKHIDDRDKRTVIEANHVTSMYLREKLELWRDSAVFEWRLPRSFSLCEWAERITCLRLEDGTYPLYNISGISVMEKTLNCCSASLKLLAAAYGIGAAVDHGQGTAASVLLASIGSGAALGAAAGLAGGPFAEITVPVGVAVGATTGFVGHFFVRLPFSKTHSPVLRSIFEQREKIAGTKIVKRKNDFKVIRSAGLDVQLQGALRALDVGGRPFISVVD